MTIVPLSKAYVMNAATLYIAADDYTEAVSQVELSPTVQSSTWRGIGGNVRRAQSIAEWSCALGFAQDLAPEGLLRYLLEHDGETVAAVLVPLDPGPAIEVDLILTPGTIGGAAGSDLAVSTATLAVDGTPVFNDTWVPPVAARAADPSPADV